MKWAAVVACWLLAGCTTTVATNQIEPAKTDDLHYAGKNCKQLGRNASQIYAELSARSQANDNQTGEFTDGNVTRIAQLKGELSAITATMATKGCPIS